MLFSRQSCFSSVSKTVVLQLQFLESFIDQNFNLFISFPQSLIVGSLGNNLRLCFLSKGNLCLKGKTIANWQQKMVAPDTRSNVNKPEDCQQKCASNPDCLSWTYKKTVRSSGGPGTCNGVAGTCSSCLNKANLEKITTPNSDFVSGTKHCTFPAV